MRARVAVSAAVSLLLALQPSPTSQLSLREKRSPDPPGGFRGRGPPGHSFGHNNDFYGPPGHNKFANDDAARDPPRNPAGPPGLGGNRPPGWNNGRPNYGNGNPGNGRPGGRPSSQGNDGLQPPPRTDVERPSGGQYPSQGNDERAPLRECKVGDFHCGSGECLPASVRCNKRFDCRDSSDEDNCVTVENEGGCVLPKQPDGGNYELGGCGAPCNKQPGDKVPRNSILTYACRDGYVLHGNTISVCVNDGWYNLPRCLKTCSGLTSSSVDLTCSYERDPVPCNERTKPGTVATLSCKQAYKLPLTNDPGYRELKCLQDGLWDRRLFRCLPECGTVISHGNTLVVNGFESKPGIFPWHVGIYGIKKHDVPEQICGGTLISNNLVLSAAHCFYDETYDKVLDASQFAVAAGKHYRSWSAKENYAQKSLVEKIELPDRYIGARGNFAQDIALLKLKTPFELTAFVRPICMDWDNVYERVQLQVGQTGKAVGWGKTIHGLPSEILQEVNLPFVPYDQCVSAVPDDFRGYITSDKFCAGHLNGTSLCEGDSGGGLCFEKDGVWYIRGIVSVSPVKHNTCDYNSYVGFTYISHFRDWIRSAYINS